MSTIAIYFLINIFTFRETTTGNWSYGGEIIYYKEILGDINFIRIAAIYVYGYLRSFNILIFILPFVLYYLYKHNKELFYIFIVIVLIHIPVAIPEARYGGYQMTVYPIIAISAGLFINNLLIKHRYIVLSLILFYICVNIYIVSTERAFHRDLKDTYVQLSHNLKITLFLLLTRQSDP